MAGLARLCKLYGSMVIQGKRLGWDYAADTAVPEEEMPLGGMRHAASERAKWQRSEESMDALADAFPAEVARVRELLGEYQKLGSAGRFGVTVILQALQEADNALMHQDTVAMVRIYAKLKGIQ